MEARYFRLVPDTTMRMVPTPTGLPATCTTTVLPAGGVIYIDPINTAFSLTSAAIYQAACPTASPMPSMAAPPVIVANSGLTFDDTAPAPSPQFSDFRDPFYGSTFPICYALAATTVIAYTLVIVLFIAPRSFLDGGVVYLGRRGFTSSTSPGVTIGGRPWLQKIAALTVAISLTIATADTFKVAEQQYAWGIQNSIQLQQEVMDGTELKVIRLISDTFLWLAQAQTLIRLFPRHREKVIIKWTAFALITLDVIFSALNSFQDNTSGSNGNQRPKSFADAIPALSYLFQLSLGLLYAAWVIYYSLMKKRYAFYHPLMKNMCLVATISIGAILVPVVFFVLDISKPDFTGWGDYVRWVGAAAASVVVWEWVERIEALEREEKKDGILGREVFEGDEMLEISASEFPWLRRRTGRKQRKDDHDDHDFGAGGGGGGGGRLNLWPGVSSIANRYRSQHNPNQQAATTNETTGSAAAAAATTTQRTMGDLLRPPLWPSRPPPAVTPVSRTDTVSADSTVYAVRYQPASDSSTTPEPVATTQQLPLMRQARAERPERDDSSVHSHEMGAGVDLEAATEGETTAVGRTTTTAKSRSRWRTLAQAANPMNLKRTVGEPPDGTPRPPPSRKESGPPPPPTHDENSRWDIKARLEDFAATQAERLRERIRPTVETSNLPVMVIPAPPRRGAALAQVLAEESGTSGRVGSSSGVSGASGTSSVARPSIDSTSAGHTSYERFPPLVTQSSGGSPSSRGGEADPLRPGAPPMWPGVRPRGEPIGEGGLPERRYSEGSSVRSGR